MTSIPINRQSIQASIRPRGTLFSGFLAILKPRSKRLAATSSTSQAENHIVPFLPSLIQEPNHSNQNPPAVEYVPGHHRKSEDDVSDDGSTSSSDADFPDHFYRTARFRTKDDVEIELLILFDTGSSKNFAFPKAVTLLGLDCQPIPRNHIHWYTSPIKDGCEVKPEYFVEAMFTVPGLIHEEQEVKLKIIEDATDELDIIIGKPFMAAYREKYGVSLLGQLEDTQPEIRNPRHGRAVLVLKKGARRKDADRFSKMAETDARNRVEDDALLSKLTADYYASSAYQTPARSDTSSSADTKDSTFDLNSVTTTNTTVYATSSKG